MSISSKRVLVTADDFAAAGVERTSPVHTNNVIGVQHTDTGVTTLAAYYQVDENVVAARITVVAAAAGGPSGPNASASASAVAVVLGLDSGMKVDDPHNDTFTTTVLPAPAVGSPDGSMLQCAGIDGDWTLALAAPPTGGASLKQHAVYGSVEELRAGLLQRGGNQEAAKTFDPAAAPVTTESKQLYAALVFSVPAGSTSDFTVLMARSAPNSDGNAPGTTVRNIAAAIAPSALPPLRLPSGLPLASLRPPAVTAQYLNQWNRRVVEDSTFWSKAAKLDGAWPESWKRGFVYDLNTVRANIRPAVGVFKHPWDAMQVHGPRIVAAESSMDTMVLSYADVELAKEVLYGLYADTAARGQPQVPCQTEDGTTNMECMDNHTAGTPPSWGAPIWTVQSIFLRDGDKAGQPTPLSNRESAREY